MPSTYRRKATADTASLDASAAQPLSEPCKPLRRGSRISPLPTWRLQRVEMLVESRIAETVTLADLAGAAGISRMHFAAQFRAATGMRPHDYVLSRRILRAMMEMSTPEMPLAQLALAVGFQSQSHFSTVFKRLTGTSPGAWRSGERTVVPFPTPPRPQG